jgi:hypothetical protein
MTVKAGGILSRGGRFADEVEHEIGYSAGSPGKSAR